MSNLLVGAGHGPKLLEGVRLAPLDVLQPVERRVGPRPLERAGTGVQGDHRPGAAGQVQGEGAVVGEAVERTTAGSRRRPGEDPVRPLIEEGAGLLTVPWRREVPHRAFADLDLAWHRADDRLDIVGEPLATAGRHVVSEEDALGLEQGDDRVEDLLPHRLQAGGEDLGDDPAVVAVNHERREAVPFAVHHAPGGGIDARASLGRPGEPLAPPGGVHLPLGPLQQSQADLGGRRQEALPDETASGVLDPNEAGLRRVAAPRRCDRSMDVPAPSARRRAP